MHIIVHRPPRMEIVWEVYEAAKDVGDQMVIAACQRLIEADRLGWRKHARDEDKALVREFAQ